jgi:hypothetical protein
MNLMVLEGLPLVAMLFCFDPALILGDTFKVSNHSPIFHFTFLFCLFFCQRRKEKGPSRLAGTFADCCAPLMSSWFLFSLHGTWFSFLLLLCSCMLLTSSVIPPWLHWLLSRR